MFAFTNLTAASVDKRFFQKVAGIVLGEEGRGEEDLSIVLVNGKKMKELNKKYRKEDRVTDVLSFVYQGGGSFVFPRGNLVKLGEVVICPEYVEEVSRERGLDFSRELGRVTIHGILHILGYNHKTSGEMKKMNELQERYLRLLGE